MRKVSIAGSCIFGGRSPHRSRRHRSRLERLRHHMRESARRLSRYGEKPSIIRAIKSSFYVRYLWLGAVAVLFLPRVVIPLRHVDSRRAARVIFPEVGYDQYEGAWMKSGLGFGKDKTITVIIRSIIFRGWGLGSGMFRVYKKKNGRRTASVNFYGIHDQRTQSTTYNLSAQEQENISKTLRAKFSIKLPKQLRTVDQRSSNSSFNAGVIHTAPRSSQNYSFSYSSVGSQSSSTAFAFTDVRQITPTPHPERKFFALAKPSDYGGFFCENSSANFTSLTHLVTHGADYQLIFDKTFSQQPYGIDKLPELQIHPYNFLDHFVIPIQAAFTVGEYCRTRRFVRHEPRRF